LGIKNGELLFCVLYAFLCVAAKLKKKSDSSAAVQKNVIFYSANGPVIALGSQDWTTHFPPMNLNHGIRKYRFVGKIMRVCV
jgi:hypothetical protein